MRKSAVVDISSTDATLATAADGIIVAVAGNVLGWLEDDDTNTTVRTFALLAGVVYPLRFKKIQRTSTTATGIIALYFQ